MTDGILAPGLDLPDLLNETEASYDWLIPDLLERGDRVIITGKEGKGKSTLLRQMAVQAALGIHPFTLEPHSALKVVLIDLENSRRQTRRELLKVLGDRIPPYGLHVVNWSQGIDLTQSIFTEAVARLLTDQRPDLLVIGPMYKMAPHLELEEASADLAKFLDTMRVALDFAILMESHQPHQTIIEGKIWRAERPYGSSLWMRWPEFGLCLENDGSLRAWRGARDEDREWPSKLSQGDPSTGGWLWESDRRACAICGEPLMGKQQRYCSDRCSWAGNKRSQRRRG